MARNRKYQSSTIRFGPALKAFLFCLLIGGSGVGYVWQKSQINELGKQISRREHCLKDLADQNENLKKQLGTLRSPRFLEQRIKELNLSLVQPPISQVWVLAEPARDLPRPDSERRYAAQNPAAPAMP
jgi:hypothetical protein